MLHVDEAVVVMFFYDLDFLLHKANVDDAVLALVTKTHICF
jgi:hypothetical protein